VTGVRVFRQPFWLRLLAGFTGLAVVLAAGGIDSGGWLAVLGPLGGAVAIALAVRNWHLRVEVGSDLRLVNTLRTVRIPWPEVKRFGYDRGLWVQVVDGRQLDVSAFSQAPGQLSSATRRGEAVARELERIRKRRR